MRDIRSRIAQRSGVDLSNQQIQELAARRLDAILDPRNLKPGLLDQLRRSAGELPSAPEVVPSPPPIFEEETLYDSPSPVLRFIRRLLNPLLRLLFNPTPIAHALAVQGRLDAEIAAREAERDRRQAEWNALHFEILQRVVTEISRVSLEGQSQGLRVESLSAKVDFNERRVRGIEGVSVRTTRPQEGAAAMPQTETVAAVASSNATTTAQQPAEGQPPQSGDAPRRRRRRRRGRRGAGGAIGPQESTSAATGGAVSDEQDSTDVDEPLDNETSVAEPMVMKEATSAEPPAVAEVPPDHRLPEPVVSHESPAATPPAQDADPTARDDR
jgi:hypothetical protein